MTDQEKIKREDVNRIHDEYLDKRRLHIEAEYNAIEGFARALLTLSAGALGLSLTYIRFAVKDPIYVGWLIASWILFALTLLLTIGALYNSHQAFRESRKLLKKRYKAEKSDYFENFGKVPNDHQITKIDSRNQSSENTQAFNNIAFVSFSLGSIALLFFTTANILSN